MIDKIQFNHLVTNFYFWYAHSFNNASAEINARPHTTRRVSTSISVYSRLLCASPDGEHSALKRVHGVHGSIRHSPATCSRVKPPPTLTKEAAKPSRRGLSPRDDIWATGLIVSPWIPFKLGNASYIEKLLNVILRTPRFITSYTTRSGRWLVNAWS